MPDDTPAALFVPLDDGRLQPTGRTRGPWSEAAQHGGPVCALLAGAVEEPGGGRRVVRLTVELLRPVPLSPVRLEVDPPVGGRSADRVAARVRDDAGVVVAEALALRIRTKPVAVPEQTEEPPPWRPEDARAMGAADLGFLAGRETFLTEGMEVRFSEGAFDRPGPAVTWFRLRVPVVAGEPTSPLQRVAAAADFGNGISGLADMQRLLFVNPDLTVAVWREPEGEWVALEARSRLEPDGIGGAESALWDTRGRIGRSYQTLLVSER